MTGSCARRAVCTRCCIHSTSNRSRRRSEQDSSALEPRILWSMWLRFIPSCTDYGRSVKVEMSLRRKKEVSSMQVMACAKWPHSHAMGTNNRVIQINSIKVKMSIVSNHVNAVKHIAHRRIFLVPLEKARRRASAFRTEPRAPRRASTQAQERISTPQTARGALGSIRGVAYAPTSELDDKIRCG